MLGFYNIIKPTGMSSTAVVGKIKHLLGTKRAGHMGTLDPAAAGVLTVAVGKATKFFDYFLNKDKVYYAIAEFGITTSTLDSEGEIISVNNKIITREQINKKIGDFIGEINQVPPLYSAIKVDGKRAYDLARAGQNVELRPRRVKIFDFELMREIKENTFEFKIWCSSGTYVRSLLNDLALSLDTIANVPVIIRTKCGHFNIKEAVTIEEIGNSPKNCLISVEDVFKSLKRIEFNSQDIKKVENGVTISDNGYCLGGDDEFLGYISGQLVGLFSNENNQIKCKINLRG